MTSCLRICIGCCLALLSWKSLAQDANDLIKGLLIEASWLQHQQAQPLKDSGYKQLVINIQSSPTNSQLRALQRLKEHDLEVWYWIEIARDEQMAAQHPEWMASIQGHPEWRRFHPNFPKETQGEVVKVFPWVPVFFEGAFEAHFEKVNDLLEQWPSAKGVFLNDLQGAPTACGCGHTLCRWTTDYGPKTTARNLGHTAPAQFIKRVMEAHPDMECIPVWTTECEAHDKDSLCAGVGCYNGACWREWSKQLAPISQATTHLAALLTYKELQRDLDVYGTRAGWIPKAIDSFASESKRFNHPAVPPERLIGILQGWNTTPEEETAQIRHLEKSGTHGFILSKMPITSEWEPRILKMDGKPLR